MRVFLTGASGFIGSAITAELLEAGHQVLGLARSEAAAKSLRAAGADVHQGSLDDLASLRSGAAAADGVIHTAFIHAFSGVSLGTRLRIILGGLPAGIAARFMAAIAATDRQAIEALGEALVGSGRPLVVTSGTLLLPLGRLVTEHDDPDPTSPAAYRATAEAAALALAARGVRTAIVRLPPTVHGTGDYGFVPQLGDIARKKGVAAYVGKGLNRWPAVHRLDAARLFRLALERGTAGARYHGVAEEAIPFGEIAAVMGQQLGLAVAERPANHFSFFGPIVAADNPTSSAFTQQELGWTPTQPGLLADLKQENYLAVV